MASDGAASPDPQLLRRVCGSPGLPVATPTSPAWLDDAPDAALCDVQHALPPVADVVIDSGITAAAVAKTLLDLDGASVVVEARQLCSGATGRNGGHIKVTPHHEFARLAGRLGPLRARRLVRFQLMHLPVLLGLGRLHPSGDVREVETADLYVDRAGFDEAAAHVDALRQWLPEVDVEVLVAPQARDRVSYLAPRRRRRRRPTRLPDWRQWPRRRNSLQGRRALALSPRHLALGGPYPSLSETGHPHTYAYRGRRR